MGRSVEIVAGDTYIWQVIYMSCIKRSKLNSFYFLYFVDILPINKRGSSKTFGFCEQNLLTWKLFFHWIGQILNLIRTKIIIDLHVLFHDIE